MKSKKWRIGAVLLAVVILTGAIAGAANANLDSEADKSMSTLYNSFVSKLATNLGIDQDTVESALDTTKNQIIEEAVEQGKLTQEQADKIASGKGMDFGFGFRVKGHNFDGQEKAQKFNGQGLKFDGIASILGITDDQLKAEMESGKKIQDIITEHGLTMDQIHEKMLELKKEEISKAVEDGKITQEQADKFLKMPGKRLLEPASPN